MSNRTVFFWVLKDKDVSCLNSKKNVSNLMVTSELKMGQRIATTSFADNFFTRGEGVGERMVKYWNLQKVCS